MDGMYQCECCMFEWGFNFLLDFCHAINLSTAVKSSILMSSLNFNVLIVDICSVKLSVNENI